MIDIGQAASAASTRELLNLPDEILQTVLEQCQPEDLGRLCMTCTTARDSIRDNELLWKNVYLTCYDEPRNELDWIATTQALVRSQKLLDSRDRDVQCASRIPVINTIVKLLATADGEIGRSRNLKVLQDAFLGGNGRLNQDIYLCGSSLFQRSSARERWSIADTEHERQLVAKLHCLFGAPRYGWATSDPEADTHAYARASVYDLEKFTEETKWGPFSNDGSGSVDWEKMETIITVLGYNLKLFSDRTNRLYPEIWTEDRAWEGASPYSCRSLKQKTGDTSQRQPKKGHDDGFLTDEARALAMKDPYGITGTWHRIVCFLDYMDFFTFNFNTDERDFLDHEEATRLIVMRFKVTDIEIQKDGALPVVHFTGDSRAMDIAPGDQNADSAIIGRVSATTEGEIRWTTWSVYDGEQRWRSEGIQVGGIQSGRGVVGNWFDKNYDPHGPAGPTAFWKHSTEVPPLKRRGFGSSM